MNLTIRIATKADAQLIADMSHSTFIDSFGADNTKENMDKFLSFQFNKGMLIREVGSVNNIFLLAYLDDQPAGYVRLREHNNPPELGFVEAIELARLYAVKDFIGKGIGKALMKECINIAIEKKQELLWLGVWEHNKRAIDFYTKWGFEKFSDHEFILGDDVQNDWLMKKQLGEKSEEGERRKREK